MGGARDGTGKKGKKFFQTTAGVLMKVGVPGSHERKAKGVSEDGAELAEFARAGHMNHIRLEGREGATKECQMTPEKEIVAKIAFDAEAKKTARQFDRG